jgi:hypothetical protein
MLIHLALFMNLSVPDKEHNRNHSFRGTVYSIFFATVETVLYCITKEVVRFQFENY